MKRLLIIPLLLFALSSRADLVFVMTPATLPGMGSNEVFFTGTLTNTSPTDNLFLNNIQVSPTDAATNYLGADTNTFFANVPGILLPGETYSDIVFGITIPSSTPPGQYSGTVTLQGGPDIFAVTNLSSQTFQVALLPAALGITNSSANLLITWPSPPGGFVLQENSDLTTTNWTPVAITPTFTNGLNQARLWPAISNQFFRLEYP